MPKFSHTTEICSVEQDLLRDQTVTPGNKDMYLRPRTRRSICKITQCSCFNHSIIIKFFNFILVLQQFCIIISTIIRDSIVYVFIFYYWDIFVFIYYFLIIYIYFFNILTFDSFFGDFNV